MQPQRPAGNDGRRLPAEDLLDPYGQRGHLRVGVVDPHVRAAGHQHPLRGQLVQAAGDLPRHQRAQGGGQVQPLQVVA